MRRLALLPILAAALLATLAAPSSATAGLTRLTTGSFGVDGTSGTSFTDPNRLALNGAGDKLYVFDPGGASPHLYSFGNPSLTPSGGAFPLTLAEGGTNSGIGVDGTSGASAGNLYYATNFAKEIYGFDSAGSPLGGNFPFVPGGGGPSVPCGSPGVDSEGNLFVADYGSNLIREYDSAGSALAMIDASGQSSGFAKPCNAALGSDDDLFVGMYRGPVWRYTAASGYDPGSATKIDPVDSRAIAVDLEADELYVAHQESVSVYDTQTGDRIYDFPTAGKSEGIAIDHEADRVYVSNTASGSDQVDVYGSPVSVPDVATAAASGVTGSAATLNGAVDPLGLEVTDCAFEYVDAAHYEPEAADPYAAGQSEECAESPAEIGSGTGDVEVHLDVSGLSAETTYHYRLTAANANGAEEGPDSSFETDGVPQILGAGSHNVTLAEASLKAQINPHGAETSYRFEWGLAGAPYEHVTDPASIGSESVPQVASLFLQGLAAGTAYRFRVVATNELGVAEGNDTTFTTYRAPAPFAPCANDAYRTGSSAQLPDCRAYEMVSPVDKNGRDIIRALAGAKDPGAYVQAATDGNRIAYTALFAAFAEQPSGFVHNQYLAGRTERGQSGEGWSSEGIHPPVIGITVNPGEVFGLPRDFMAFTPDLCSAWLVDNQTPPFAADGQVDRANLYRRQNCGAGKGGLEALVPDPPYGLPAETPARHVTKDSIGGSSSDGSRVFFVAKAKLTEEASEGVDTVGRPVAEVYERVGGELRVASVLPDAATGDPIPGDGAGFANPSEATIGSDSSNTVQGAVSEDGTRVYWSAGEFAKLGKGKIYVRAHPEQGIVAGECSAAAKACTRAVSSGSEAFFWGASNDGSKALFSEEEDLYQYDLAKAEEGKTARTKIAEGVRGVAGFSDDLSRIYFVSREDQGAEANEQGDEAIEGEPNLYLLEDGEFTFIGTLAETDTGASEAGGDSVAAYDLGARVSYQRATRVTPDGSRIAFNSRAPLSGFDNTDTTDGRPVVEVFSFEADSGELSCISCNPTGARPSGAPELRLPYNPPPLPPEYRTNVPAAAWIPTWEHPLHASNVLSEDGTRIFFHSNEALLPRDTNGAQDVYEWEAPGTGSCTAEEDNPSYFPQNDGCIYLISSGVSPSESEFWEASPDGSDVFFTTAQSLVARDPGSVDLYDARVQGGFPEAAAPAACEGEACQSPPPAPEAKTPASSAFRGAGNLAPSRECSPLARRLRALAHRNQTQRRRARGLARRARSAGDQRAARALRRRSRRLAKSSRRRAKAAKRLAQRTKRCRAQQRGAGRRGATTSHRPSTPRTEEQQ